MESHKRLAELLVETGAFEDLKSPVILASGKLGIYYVKAQNLVQDGGEFKNHGDNSKAMVNHAVAMTQQHPTFKEVIEILAQETDRYFTESNLEWVSGGQRRDWLFSGPIARELSRAHVSIYKDGKIEVISPKGNEVWKHEPDDQSLRSIKVVHVADLLTAGSSCYRKQEDKEEGWIPEIRRRGGTIKDLMTVITRLQGGEENLKAQGVDVHSFVTINHDFLRAHSQNPEALKYFQNPDGWGGAYVSKNGALGFLPDFNPEGGRLDKAKAFLGVYGGLLRQTGGFQKLDDACRGEYKMGVDEILRDVK